MSATFSAKAIFKLVTISSLKNIGGRSKSRILTTGLILPRMVMYVKKSIVSKQVMLVFIKVMGGKALRAESININKYINLKA